MRCTSSPTTTHSGDQEATGPCSVSFVSVTEEFGVKGVDVVGVVGVSDDTLRSTTDQTPFPFLRFFDYTTLTRHGLRRVVIERLKSALRMLHQGEDDLNSFDSDWLQIIGRPSMSRPFLVTGAVGPDSLKGPVRLLSSSPKSKTLMDRSPRGPTGTRVGSVPLTLLTYSRTNTSLPLDCKDSSQVTKCAYWTKLRVSSEHPPSTRRVNLHSRPNKGRLRPKGPHNTYTLCLLGLP